jgi:hypothetical protein
MESLPLELWYKIFTQIPLREKMECMSVCRSWWKYFEDSTLLSHVEIKDNPEQFTAFMNMLKRMPHRKLQIIRLELNNCIPEKYNKRKLFNIFSTVRVLKVLNDRDTGSKRVLQRRTLKTMPSHSQIESLTDSFHCELALQMLVSNKCNLLGQLQLDFFGVESANRIFHELKHAPVLQQLLLRSVAISLDDLEVIHKNAPFLNVLRLEWIYIKRSNSYPSNIVPVPRLRTLHFSIYDASNLDTHISLYKYINQKYVNIIHVQHKDAKKYYYRHDDLKLFYTNGYLEYLELVSQRQGHKRRMDVFDVVRASGLPRPLLQPNQFHNTHTLTLKNTAPRMLRHMPVLHTLKLHFTGPRDPPTIDLTRYFNGCPESVTSFDISCFQVRFDPSMIRKCHIKSLSVNCNTITSDFFKLVDNCLPALLRLKLAGSIFGRVAIRLDDVHPLEEVAFILDGRNPLGFTFKDDRDYHQYLCNSGDTRLATWDDIRGLPTMAVISYIPRRVILDGQDIIRVVKD